MNARPFSSCFSLAARIAKNTSRAETLIAAASASGRAAIKISHMSNSFPAT